MNIKEKDILKVYDIIMHYENLQSKEIRLEFRGKADIIKGERT